MCLLSIPLIGWRRSNRLRRLVTYRYDMVASASFAASGKAAPGLGKDMKRERKLMYVRHYLAAGILCWLRVAASFSFPFSLVAAGVLLLYLHVCRLLLGFCYCQNANGDGVGSATKRTTWVRSKLSSVAKGSREANFQY